MSSIVIVRFSCERCGKVHEVEENSERDAKLPSGWMTLIENRASHLREICVGCAGEYRAWWREPRDKRDEEFATSPVESGET